MQLQTDTSLVTIEIVQGLDLVVTDVLADCSKVSDRWWWRSDHQDMSLYSTTFTLFELLVALGKVSSHDCGSGTISVLPYW